MADMIATPFGTATDGTDATPLLQDQWRALIGGISVEGILRDLNGLALRVTAPGSSTLVSIAPGNTVIDGFLGTTTAATTLDVGAVGVTPTSSQRRIDRIVVRLTTSTKKIELLVRPGTPGTVDSAVPPNLTREPLGIWEHEIARVDRLGNVAVNSANLTRTRAFTGANAFYENEVPGNMPIGSIVTDATGQTQRRVLNGTNPEWWPVTGGPFIAGYLPTNAVFDFPRAGWIKQVQPFIHILRGFANIGGTGRIVIPMPGVYTVTARQRVSGPAGLMTMHVATNAGGVGDGGDIIAADYADPRGDNAVLSLSVTRTLTAGDTVELFVTAGATSQRLVAGPAWSTFEVEYKRK